MHLQDNTLLTFDLGVKVTTDVAQYPLHHETYTPLKLLRPSLEEDTIKRKVTDTHAHRGTQTNFGTELIYPFLLKKKLV